MITVRFIKIGVLLLLILTAACVPSNEPAVVTRQIEPTAVPTDPTPEISPTPTQATTAEATADSSDIQYIDTVDLSPALPLADYPPSSTPYYLETGDFWLSHTPDGQLFAFAPTSPDYVDRAAAEECRFVWTEAVGRFIDPCSGDEWELSGRLDLESSPELWSDRDLDQYRLMVQEGAIRVQLDRLIPGIPIHESPLALDAQHGITVTAVLSDFSASGTTIGYRVQVAPIWGMDPSAFPPQQALTYPTFPDSLFDDQGRTHSILGGEGSLAVFDPHTGGLKQGAHIQWEAVAPDANTITATLTVHLSSLHREITLPLDWANHQPEDSWAEEIPLEIGYAAVRVEQVEWLETTDDGLARLRLTVTDESPDDIRLYCLHLDIDDPWRRTCANFDGELTYLVITQPGQPVALHLRAALELLTPFQLVLKPDH